MIENELLNDEYIINRELIVTILNALRDGFFISDGVDDTNNYIAIDAYEALVLGIRKQQ